MLPIAISRKPTVQVMLYSQLLKSSPKPLCPHGRTTDIDAILDVISKAQHYVHIAVMDYFPLTLYTPHRE